MPHQLWGKKARSSNPKVEIVDFNLITFACLHRTTMAPPSRGAPRAGGARVTGQCHHQAAESPAMPELAELMANSSNSSAELPELAELVANSSNSSDGVAGVAGVGSRLQQLQRQRSWRSWWPTPATPAQSCRSWRSWWPTPATPASKELLELVASTSSVHGARDCRI